MMFILACYILNYFRYIDLDNQIDELQEDDIKINSVLEQAIVSYM